MLTSVDSTILVLARVDKNSEIRIEHGLFRRFLKDALADRHILASRGQVEDADEASNGGMNSHRDAFFGNCRKIEF